LDGLKAIGTGAALMHLSDIAHTVRVKDVQDKAEKLLREVRGERRTDIRSLEDRSVPNLGLDERGGLTLYYGPRTFRVLIRPDLKPVVKDQDGALRADLPQPSRRDDADKAAAAIERWQRFRPQLREAFRLQSARLERAMLDGRHWTVRQF